MVIPDAVRRLAGDPQFWTLSCPRGRLGDYPELEDCRVEFPIADGYHLTLRLDEMLASFDPAWSPGGVAGSGVRVGRPKRTTLGFRLPD